MAEIKRAVFKPHKGHLQIDADLHAKARAEYTTDLERERDELRAEGQRLKNILDQFLSDREVIRAMLDPDGRFKAETLVWIVSWLRRQGRIRPPIKTEKGWL